MGNLEYAVSLSNTEDEIALQGKDPSAPTSRHDAKLAGHQSVRAGGSPHAGGIPVAFGENAPDILPARVGAPRNFSQNETKNSDTVIPKLLAARLGGDKPDGNGEEEGILGAESNGGLPGKEGDTGLSATGNTGTDKENANNVAPLSKDIQDKKTPKIDSRDSYKRGLVMIYYLIKRGGKYDITPEQAQYILRAIDKIESDRLDNISKPLLAIEPKRAGNSNDDGGDAYHEAFLMLYALEAKGGKYAITKQQAEYLLRIIEHAESQKRVVPDAQRDLPKVLTADQRSYIRAKLSAEAAQGKRTDPQKLNTYANEILQLTK